MQILQTSLITPKLSPHTLSFSFSKNNNNNFITTTTTRLSSLTHHRPPPSTVIRNGGGPRTFPGGVSKWEWKRMQAKKSKQLLKARLSRERNMYEMRKRAEIKAAVSNLERPWQIVQNSPSSSSSSNTSSLFSVSADEQLKVLADRFQKPGGFDLWSHNDGPQILGGDNSNTNGGSGSARFFPKGVVHSVKPYAYETEDLNNEGNYSGVNRKTNSKRGVVEVSDKGIFDGRVVDSNKEGGKNSSFGDRNGRNYRRSGRVKEFRKIKEP